MKSCNSVLKELGYFEEGSSKDTILLNMIYDLHKRLKVLEGYNKPSTVNLLNLTLINALEHNKHLKHLVGIIGKEEASMWFVVLNKYQPYSGVTLDQLLLRVTQQFSKGYSTYGDVREMCEIFPETCISIIGDVGLGGNLSKEIPEFMSKLYLDLEAMNEN